MKQKSYAVLKLSVICMIHLIGILIGFTYYWGRQRHKQWKQSQFYQSPQLWVHRFLSTSCKNDMWIEITNIADSEVRTVRIPQVFMYKLA